MHSSVYSSLHPICQDQIVLAKLNLTIFSRPPYKRLFCHYQQANADLIKRAIQFFLTGIKILIILMLTNRFLLLTKRLCASFKILLRTKQSLVMTKILTG